MPSRQFPSPFFQCVYFDMSALVKYIPEWFPGAGFKKMARQYEKRMRKLLDEPFAIVKEAWVCHSSITRKLT